MGGTIQKTCRFDSPDIQSLARRCSQDIVKPFASGSWNSEMKAVEDCLLILRVLERASYRANCYLDLAGSCRSLLLLLLLLLIPSPREKIAV